MLKIYTPTLREILLSEFLLLNYFDHAEVAEVGRFFKDVPREIASTVKPVLAKSSRRLAEGCKKWSIVYIVNKTGMIQKSLFIWPVRDGGSSRQSLIIGLLSTFITTLGVINHLPTAAGTLIVSNFCSTSLIRRESPKDILAIRVTFILLHVSTS